MADDVWFKTIFGSDSFKRVVDLPELDLEDPLQDYSKSAGKGNGLIKHAEAKDLYNRMFGDDSAKPICSSDRMWQTDIERGILGEDVDLIPDLAPSRQGNNRKGKTAAQHRTDLAVMVAEAKQKLQPHHEKVLSKADIGKVRQLQNEWNDRWESVLNDSVKFVEEAIALAS